MILREFRLDDAASLTENANNIEVAKYLRDIFPSPYTIEDAHWWLNEGYQTGMVYNLAITHNDECIGSIGALFTEAERRYTASKISTSLTNSNNSRSSSSN